MRARAPGKIVLSGAYAVLEGAPAVVTAVSRYAVADTEKAASFITDEVKCARLSPAPWFDASELRDNGRKLGLGSSAAILVASLAAARLAQRGPLDDEALAAQVLRPALDAHALAQPLGSGVDVYAACLGGTRVVTRTGKDRVVQPIALVQALVIEVWAAPNASRTHDMLLRLAEFRSAQRSLYAKRLERQSEASERAAIALRRGDAELLLRTLAEQLQALQSLGRDARIPIVTPEVAALSAMAADESAVVLPAGAGGGDVALFVGLRPPSDALRRAMVERHHRALPVALGVRGVHGVAPEC